MTITISNLISAHLKQPSEVLPIDISFGKLHVLPRGATEIVYADAGAVRWKRKFPNEVESADTFLVSTTPTILSPNNTTVRIVVAGGETDYDYKVSVVVRFDNDAILEEEVFVRVREE